MGRSGIGDKISGTWRTGVASEVRGRVEGLGWYHSKETGRKVNVGSAFFRNFEELLGGEF